MAESKPDKTEKDLRDENNPGDVLLEEPLKPKKGEPDMRSGNRGVPSKSLLEEHPQTHPGALSPGQYAEEVVGYSDAEPGSDEANEHGEKFAAAKARRRFGH
jgi:hypothetical protein